MSATTTMSTPGTNGLAPPPGPLDQPLDSSPKLDQLIPALIAAQAEMRTAVKDAENPHFKSRYADLDSIWAAAREPLHRHGLAVLHPIGPAAAGGCVEIACLLVHSSGQWMRSRLPLRADGRKPQEMGSEITYYRRYLLAALLAIPAGDDDGEAASARTAAREPHQGDRGRVNGTFPARDREPRRDQAEAPRESYPAWVARLAGSAKLYWDNELKIEGVDKSLREHLPNQFEITNHLCKAMLARGICTVEDIQKDDKPGTWDPAKVKAAVADLYRRSPRKVAAAAQSYLRDKEDVLRAKLGMPDVRDAEGGQATAEGETQEPREPGQDG